MNKNLIKPFYFFAAMTSFLVGILIYHVFRDLDMSFLRWLNIHINNSPLPVNQTPVSSFLLYNLPDGLWLLSGILFIRTLWTGNQAAGGVYIFMFCFLAVLIEGFQYFNLVPGTFDPADIITMVSIAFAEGIFYRFCVQGRI
jgi:hypothetical protein